MADEEGKTPLTKKQTQRQKKYRELSGLENNPVTKLKFPILPANVEYMDILKDGETIKSYHSEISGLRWRGLCEKLCADGMKPGKLSYALKFEDTAFIYRGFIKAIDASGKMIFTKDASEISQVQKAITQLQDQIKKNIPDQLGIQFVLDTTYRTHASEINIYKYQLELKDKEISKLESQIKDLNDQLDDADKVVIELQGNSSTNKYLDTILALVDTKKIKQSVRLESNLQLDIPEDILSILNQVDYNNIPPQEIEKIKIYLIGFVNQLPKKQ